MSLFVSRTFSVIGLCPAGSQRCGITAGFAGVEEGEEGYEVRVACCERSESFTVAPCTQPTRFPQGQPEVGLETALLSCQGWLWPPGSRMSQLPLVMSVTFPRGSSELPPTFCPPLSLLSVCPSPHPSLLLSHLTSLFGQPAAQRGQWDSVGGGCEPQWILGAPTVLVLICNTAVLGMCSHSNHDADWWRKPSAVRWVFVLRE